MTAPEKTSKRTTAPDDFEITEQMREWFREKYGTFPQSLVLEETRAFLEWHRARGKTKSSLLAEWKLWISRWQRELVRQAERDNSLKLEASPIDKEAPAPARARFFKKIRTIESQQRNRRGADILSMAVKGIMKVASEGES